jgi:hypothetical protein
MAPEIRKQSGSRPLRRFFEKIIFAKKATPPRGRGAKPCVNDAGSADFGRTAAFGSGIALIGRANFEFEKS